MSEQQQVATETERQNSSSKKPSLESYALAEQIVREEIDGGKSQTLKQYYINLMTQLEIEWFPKQQISTIGKQIVVEKKCEKLNNIPKEEITIGSWWYDITKEQGCIDPHYLHPKNTKDDTPKKQSTKINIRYIDYLKRTKEIE